MNVKIDSASGNNLGIPVVLAKSTKYYWRVRAFVDLDTSTWSQMWAFTTVGQAGIEEPGSIPGLSLYPNPVNDHLNIQINQMSGGNLLLQVSDILGKPVLAREFHFMGSGKTQTLDVSGLAKGIYIIQLNYGDRTTTRKLIISR